MRIALATFAAMPGGAAWDEPLVHALRRAGASVEYAVWDDPDVDWGRFDLVQIRSVYDYSERRAEFVAWAEEVGPRIQNAPAVVRWNSDKHYLGDLAAAGIPVIDTTYVEPGEPPPALEGTVVVKPTVSAGGRDSGRFGPRAHDAARELIAAIAGSGRAAMVQPFQASVETEGEAAIVYFDGELSHTLRKGSVLPPDQVAPQHEGLPGLTAASTMFDESLVRAAPAAPDELELGAAVIEHLAGRFGGEPPLYARVDAVRGHAGVPLIMEIELIEPNFYFDLAPAAAERLATAVLRRARGETRSALR